MIDILYIYRMKILTSDPKKIDDTKYVFVDEVQTKEVTLGRDFAYAVMRHAKEFKVVLVKKLHTKNGAIKIKIKGYASDILKLNNHCKKTTE
jgi:hypothetical protein